MAELPFNTDILIQIAELRADGDLEWLTTFFSIMTFLGDSEGYILIVCLLFWTINKRKAFKISLVTILGLYLNAGLKEIIRNPRPFVSSNTQADYWVLDPEEVYGYSTPSGHAQSGSTFWIYLANKFRDLKVTILAITLTFFIGISRPYLGVHYVEDILLGWTIGLIVANSMLKYEFRLYDYFRPKSVPFVIVFGFVGTLLIMIFVGTLLDFSASAQDFSTAGGMLNGIVAGYQLEKRHLKFQSKATSLLNGILRFIVGIILVFSVLLSLDYLFSLLAEDATLTGYLLRYIRYTTVGLTAILAAPFVFLKIGLAEKE